MLALAQLELKTNYSYIWNSGAKKVAHSSVKRIRNKQVKIK
jgi:hypothetical protein